MRLISVLLSAVGVAVCAGRQHRSDGPVGSIAARGEKPQFPADKSTAKDCTDWYDHTDDFDCEIISLAFSISIEDFLRWNPSVSASCDNLQKERSYCVRVAPPPTAPPPAKPPPPTTPVPPPPTPVKPSNGINTPQPIQPGMVGNCDAFYFVQSGDYCDLVAVRYGITFSNMLAWNPTIGSECEGLQADVNVCVSIVGHQGKPPNSVETPLPIQPGMVGNCAKFHLVKTGDTCSRVATANGISLADFLKWNPDVGGSSCGKLQRDAYACVGLLK